MKADLELSLSAALASIGLRVSEVKIVGGALERLVSLATDLAIAQGYMGAERALTSAHRLAEIAQRARGLGFEFEQLDLSNQSVRAEFDAFVLRVKARAQGRPLDDAAALFTATAARLGVSKDVIDAVKVVMEEHQERDD